MKPQRLERSLTRSFRLLHALLSRRRRHFLERDFNLQKDGKPIFPPLNLGTYSGEGVVEEVFDGDLTVASISGNCKVTLESRHGSITIKHKIERGAYAKLQAAGAVTIGEDIEQHSIVQIVAGGDVTIGQTINQNSQATITSTAGKIDIGSKMDNCSEARLTAGTTVHIGQDIDQHSTAFITAQGDVTIEGNINRHATVNIISLHGAISIGRMVKDSIASLTAGTTVHIADKLDEHSQATVLAEGDVTIGQTINQQSAATITSVNGSINIGRGLSGSAIATLIALNGSINIGGSVDRGSTVNWNAQYFNCPREDGTFNQI
jgi:hypothetical protein